MRWKRKPRISHEYSNRSVYIMWLHFSAGSYEKELDSPMRWFRLPLTVIVGFKTIKIVFSVLSRLRKTFWSSKWKENFLNNKRFEKQWAGSFLDQSSEISFEVDDTLFPNVVRIMAEIKIFWLQLRHSGLFIGTANIIAEGLIYPKSTFSSW